MPYTKSMWLERIAERTDLSARVTHLTREGTVDGAVKNGLEILIKILQEERLNGSTTGSGFIVGNRPAVCFQDAPLHSITQNLWFEQKFRKANKWAKTRYIPCGLMFEKDYVFAKGGRPVIYDKTEAAKEYLPANQWWRIVNLDMGDANAFVDWTHEREWRVPDNFVFERKAAFVLLSNPKTYHVFIQRCNQIKDIDLLASIAGIVTVTPIHF